MNDLINYVKNNKVTRRRLDGEIRDERGEKLPRRHAYVLLRQYAKDFFLKGAQPRMIALSGLRGVGKTTLTWQTAYYVYHHLTTKIFFISVDDINRLNATLYDVIDALEKVLGCPLNELDERIMLIIDEVHEAAEWQKDLKILYERGKKVFVLATGSSALLLHSSPDLASRWTLMKIFPFSFTEFILAKSWMEHPGKNIFPIKGLGKRLRNTLFYAPTYEEAKEAILSSQRHIQQYFSSIKNLLSESIPALMDEYISYHNIARFLPITNKTLIIDRVLALFERILLKDIPQSCPADVGIYNRLLFRLALSDEINFQTLARDFRIKEAEVEQLILTLHQAEILNIFLPHAGIRPRTGLARKAFFMSPSLRRALFFRIYGDQLRANLRAKLYEDILAMYLKRTLSEGVVSYGYGREKNPDFVIETMDAPVLMEIGVGKSSASQITRYGPYRFGVVVNSKSDALRYDDKKRVLHLPLAWVLLM